MPKSPRGVAKPIVVNVRPELARTSAQLTDYISGQSVRATPEERDAVQVFARRLVEDYGYEKSQIATRPQHRVRARPSDEGGSYPVDIAVFRSNRKTEDEVFIVVECKKKERKDGEHQLRLYLDMSAAEVGVWFNGSEHLYLRKVLRRDGTRTYETLPNIPRRGQRIEDIGLYKKKDLGKPGNLKAVFRDIRNHLAGMATNTINRDEGMAKEIVNLLFCKILDEQDTAPDETMTFRAGVGEPPKDVKARIARLFERVKSELFSDVFEPGETIKLDADSLTYVVGELQTYCVMQADRDAIGDAFEVFIGPALRGADGQFFTPRNVVQMVVDMVDPKPGDRIIDPACGSGGFLIASLNRVWEKLRRDAFKKGWTERVLQKREIEIATDCFRGIDKDAFLAKVCKAYLALIGDGRGGVFCTSSLQPPADWPSPVQEKIKLGTFDVVFSNPPFGTKIAVGGERQLSQYDLGHKWKRDRKSGTFIKTSNLPDDMPPHILFIERCLELLKDGGKLGIVLPESMLGNPSYEHVIAYLLDRARILAVVTMPEALFKTSGKIGTHTKVGVLVVEKGAPAAAYDVFMADAKWCGHDSRGNPTIRNGPDGRPVLLDEVPEIAVKYRQFVAGRMTVEDHKGFVLRSDTLRDRILVPKYYNPELDAYLDGLGQTHELVRLGDLVDRSVVSVETGVEVGKMAYGTGRIPFIRTSDLSNWEIKADVKQGVGQDTYDEHAASCDVKAGDILMVRDGTYLIGTSAIVTESDLPMLFQSHIFRIRVEKPEEIDPWLLFACLNSPVVRRQVRAKQFTQDIIDTLGKLLNEIVLPIPKDKRTRARLASELRETVETRIALRNRANDIASMVEGLTRSHHGDDLDDEVLS